MKLSYVLALLCVNPAWGQGFGQLATNQDGSILYFSSPLRLKGTAQYFHPKIFTWDSVNGIRLYEQRAPDVPFDRDPSMRYLGTQFFSLVAPDVSSDGSTVAITGIRLCTISDVCVLTVEEYQSTIYTAGKAALQAPGAGVLSRNGRYALLRSSLYPPVGPAKMQLLDLATGQQTQYGGAWEPPGAKHRVANDGTLVLAGIRGGFDLGQGGQLRTAVPGSSITALDPNPLINDAATLVVYQAGGRSTGPARLSVYAVAAGSSTDLIMDTADTPGFGASISDDGMQVVFLYGRDRQLYVVRSNGTGLRQITNFPEAVTEVALSGDGAVAFAVTAANRIVRIDVASAQWGEIVPPTPFTNVPAGNGFRNSFLTSYRIQVSRGAVTPIAGSGFAADYENARAPARSRAITRVSLSSVPPFPLALGGVELHAGGKPVPIAGVSPNSISYPAPWDLPDSPVDVEVWVASAAASPFVPGFEVAPAPPGFHGSSFNGPFTLAAVHQDFSSLISGASPARAGEVIHVYAKDLGPVSPAPPAGLPTPLLPRFLLSPPISCVLQADPNPGDPVDVLFAELAPDMLGVFQIDVRLPASFRGSPSALRCHIGDPVEGYSIGGFLAVAGG